MNHDERFLDSPHLPQYGNLRAICSASLPGSMSILIGIGAAFMFMVLLGLAGQVLMQIPAQNNQLRALGAVAVTVVLVIGFVIACKKLGRKLNQQALFVYDGGIHLNEGVSYVVSYGRVVQFCSGTRAVSMPWRVLKDFRAKEIKRKGNVCVEASLKMPDGRTLKVNTADGKESGKAIEALLDQMS